MSGLKKAFICPYENNSPVRNKGFYVQFNPNQITIDEYSSGDISLNRTGSGGEPETEKKTQIVQWLVQELSEKEEKTTTLSTTLFFNTLENINQEEQKDVRGYIKRLYVYMNRASSENSKTPKVVYIYFEWGPIAIAGILKGLNVTYTMFAPDGRPVRAEARISISGKYDGEEGIASLSGEKTGEWTSFGSIREKLYVDPGNWKSAAGLMQRIINPRL